MVGAVARFHQLSARQVQSLLFSSHSSQTPCDRALRRLVDENYLARVERRLVGGRQGGSGQYVYQLGRRGFFLMGDGRFEPRRTINFHALAVADTYLKLREFEAVGQLTIEGFSTEPDCHVDIAGIQVKPDLFADLVIGDQRVWLWFEVDLGTESQKQVRAKLDVYRRAYDVVDVAEWQVFPQVWWIAVDDERAKELRWLIAQGKPDDPQLFRVTTLDQLAAILDR